MALGVTALATALTLAACSGGDKDKGAGAKGAAPGRGTPQVGYVVVQPSSVAMTTELSGRTAAFESSDVRPQVTGLIRRRLFTEGALVTKGQPLYEIDPRLYRASANQARANVESAQANAESTRILADRYKPLAAMEAISKQDYTNAVSSARQAQATVAQNQAALDTARINLKFTRVPAPISGRIGRSLFTVGALVSATQTDPLAQIQRLDPMFVDIQQSAGDIVRLRQSLGKGGVVATAAQVHLKLDDGSDYPLTGTVEFSEVLVDQTTGTVTLRAKFANPQGLLLPGMFVHASFAQAIDNGAFLVPQAGVSRDAKGNATVILVGPGDKAVLKDVTAARTQGPYWVVTKGLNPGDKVIVQGLSKLKPGQGIKPVPANTPQKVEVPKGADTTPKKAG
ncbi:efflux RND transporter periplasmic adaptor subunit [Sphingomonas sp. CROZ-RG-20F-R02-07]|uniref:efflux RND transporter periplasmic adaptor subunit n=1 Tax=Sphingomonas sp. CROZ-RG-20F-R02-07 TaxID=2914832 RepID=UPI001F58D319|nr:efflux RND transporter periplasmic adaptor subunit [Sphingomonas sp. CROZ-RG-20F-R02-07]